MTIKALYPTVRPTLNLDFAKTKALDPRVTFTRASTATFVGADGLIKTAGNNVPRFDHNPATGESLGLLVEDPRTNLLLRSEEFGTTWAATRSSISVNTTVAPNSTVTADSFIEDSTATSSHFVDQAYTYSAGSYALSLYVKANTRSEIRLIGFDGVTTYACFFNLSTGVVGAATGGAVGSIQALANGWYRCAITFTAAAGTGYARFGLAVSGSQTYTGDGTSGLFLWGAQLEAGAFPTSYILNVNTPLGVTRAADVANLPTTGWMDTTGGTILTEYYRLPLTSFFYASLWSLGLGNPALGYTNGGLHNDLDSLGGGQGYSLSFPVLPGKNRAAFKFQNVGQWSTTQNGATPLSSIISSAWSSSPTVLDLGYSAGVPFGTWRANAPISRLAYYPPLLPNAQLQALTAT